jgi:hypothetical protein
MNVDFYECDSCEESRYKGNVARCESCGHIICDDCVIDNDNGDDIFDLTNDYCELLKQHCPFCSGDEVHDSDLLQFTLDKLGLTKDQAVEIYRKERG